MDAEFGLLACLCYFKTNEFVKTLFIIILGVIPGQGPYPSMPMPMPGGGAYTAPVPPYPTHNQPGANQLPPSYAEAVTQPPTNEVYAKQSAYNPNYN